MKIEVKTLSDEIEKYIKDIGPNYHELYKAWPIFAGPSLAAVTRLHSFKNGTLYVESSSFSAKGLLMNEKSKILKKYQEKFPEYKIKSLALTKRT